MKKRWPGGYVHRQTDGQNLFIIEREVGGFRFHRSTRCHTREAAMAQLKRFEANPSKWSPDGSEEAPLVMTTDLLAEYREWGLTEKRNSRRHCNEQAHLLAAWVDELGTTDLRHLTVFVVREMLGRWSTRQRHRLIAFKAFMGWLRREKGLLRHHQDVSLDLSVPRVAPEKHTRRKVVEPARVQAAWRKLKGPYRDMLQLLAGTGLHVSELERFIRQPDARLELPKKGGAVLVTRHKSGEWTRIPLKHAEHIEAAKRLKRRGQVPRWFTRHVKAACRAAKVEEFGPGQMRTSVGTFAVEKGASPEEASRFLHHKDKRTTERFYIDTAVPVPAVPVIVLANYRRRRAARKAAVS